MKEILIITLLVWCQQVGAQCDVTLSTPGYNGSDVSCTGMCNANIISSSSGTAPYTFAWSTGETTSNLYSRCPGTYVLTLTDNLGCISIDSLEITEPTEVVAEILISNPLSIFSLCDGVLYGACSGGTPSNQFGYERSWFDCLTGQSYASQSYNLQNLCAGNYGLVVTDGNGCKDSVCLELKLDTCAYISSDYTLVGPDCYLGYSSQFPVDSYQWVNCNDQYSPFPGDTMATYLSGVGGFVAVIVNVLGCVDTTHCESVCFWGLDEMKIEPKEILRIINPLGNEIPERPNTLLIYLYSDGTTKKRFIVE